MGLRLFLKYQSILTIFERVTELLNFRICQFSQLFHTTFNSQFRVSYYLKNIFSLYIIPFRKSVYISLGHTSLWMFCNLSSVFFHYSFLAVGNSFKTNWFTYIEIFMRNRNGWSLNVMRISNKLDDTRARYRTFKFTIIWVFDSTSSLRIVIFVNNRLQI